MKKVAFYTLGCKLNFAETSAISQDFVQKGYVKVNFDDSPDVFVINTCSVTENADKKCRQIVNNAKKIAPNSFVVIIGCFAQLKPQKIADMPGVDAVLGASEKFELLTLLEGFQKRHDPIVCASEISHATAFHHAHSVADRTRTFLKVQDGCNYGCAFCTIPLARGKSRSDSIARLLQAAQDIAAKGVQEIVLTGVNIGDFGIQQGRRRERFVDLIRSLDQQTAIERFRISSIEPNLLSDEIIEYVAQSRRFVPHFHIPLQSGSDKILKQMNRRYLRATYADRIAKIKTSMPHACIGVDVITGFPGENHQDFLDTYHFLNQLEVSYLHVFTYSERANTPAVRMSQPVPKSERQDRSHQLRILSDKKKYAFYASQLHQKANALLENDIKGGYIHGFTHNYVKVKAPYTGDPSLVNQMKPVTLTSINSDLTMNATFSEN